MASTLFEDDSFILRTSPDELASRVDDLQRGECGAEVVRSGIGVRMDHGLAVAHLELFCGAYGCVGVLLFIRSFAALRWGGLNSVAQSPHSYKGTKQ